MLGEPEFPYRFASFGNPSFPNSRAASWLLRVRTDARIETNPRLLPLAPERSEGCSPKNWTGNREYLLFRLAKPIFRDWRHYHQPGMGSTTEFWIIAKLKVSGLRKPRLFRLAAAKRPTSMRRVLSGNNRQCKIERRIQVDVG